MNVKLNLIRGGKYNNIYYIKKKFEFVFKVNLIDNDIINKNLNNIGIFYSFVYFENIFFEFVYLYFISCVLIVINIKFFIFFIDLVECIIDKL